MDVARLSVIRNRLLAHLPYDALIALLPKLSPVILLHRQIIYNPGGAIDAVYFPESGMFSLVVNMGDGTEAEVGIIGREGILGTSLLSGIDTSFIEAMVQMPGAGLRMTVRDFQHEMEVNQSFRALVFRYNKALQDQVM